MASPGQARRQGRRWAAALALLGLVAGCDVDWEERANQTFLKAARAQQEGDFQRAYGLCQQTLKDNPYHAEANLRLAEMLDQRLFRQKQAASLAIYYYERYLDLGLTEARTVTRVRQALAMLEKIRSGELEDPADAVDDFLAAVRANQMRPFAERLDAQLMILLHNREISSQQYLDSWKTALEGGTICFASRLLDESRGQFRALVTVDFVGGKAGTETREIHLLLGNGKTWEIAGFEQTQGGNASTTR